MTPRPPTQDPYLFGSIVHRYKWLDGEAHDAALKRIVDNGAEDLLNAAPSVQARATQKLRSLATSGNDRQAQLVDSALVNHATSTSAGICRLWRCARLAASVWPDDENPTHEASSGLGWTERDSVIQSVNALLEEISVQRPRTANQLDPPTDEDELVALALHLRPETTHMQVVWLQIVDVLSHLRPANRRGVLEERADRRRLIVHSVPFPTVRASGGAADRLLVFHAAAWTSAAWRLLGDGFDPEPYPSLVWMPAWPLPDDLEPAFSDAVAAAWQAAADDTKRAGDDVAAAVRPVTWWITDHAWHEEIEDDSRVLDRQHVHVKDDSVGAAAYLALRAALCRTSINLELLAPNSDRPVSVTGGPPIRS